MKYCVPVTGLTMSAPLVAAAGDEDFPDATAFCAMARRDALFEPGEPIVVARAPGRFDVLGGIADYAGGLVLGLPIRGAALAAAQSASDGQVLAVSGSRRLAVSASDLRETPLAELARRFAGPDAWGAYVLGPLALLVREEGLDLPGLRLLLSSSVPEGKGLGSSAAVEVAATLAAGRALGTSLEPRRVALLGQRGEQLLAGAPCGVMDQMTAACGTAGHLLAILCRPAEVVGSYRLPRGLAVWGIDSGERHAVGGSPYRRVRCASFMGKALLGVDTDHLASVAPEDLDAERLPESMSGDDFLRSHRGVDDDLSSIESGVDYPVRAATVHPVEEQLRVETFAALLERPLTDSRARVLGDLMAASHESYSRCGLGTPVTDRIVASVRAAGWDEGLVGARVSGGGSGGTVVVAGRVEAEPVVRQIAETLGLGIVSGTSAGAAVFGTRVS